MAGVEDRVQVFLDSWPIVVQHLEEVVKDEGLFHGDRACRTLQGESKNNLPEALGQGNPRL